MEPNKCVCCLLCIGGQPPAAVGVQAAVDAGDSSRHALRDVASYTVTLPSCPTLEDDPDLALLFAASPLKKSGIPLSLLHVDLF